MSKFRFLRYHFNPETFVASFVYQGKDGIRFVESIEFVKSDKKIQYELLDDALFLAFMLIGTSYYKAHPTRSVDLCDRPLDDFQVSFFNQVYQEGLSQFAFENELERKNLAHFDEHLADFMRLPLKPLPKDFDGILCTQSGGKDSLLVAELLKKSGKKHSFWMLGTTRNYPKVLDELDAPIDVAIRALDMPALGESDGLSGHVPITYISMSLALIQAILNHQTTVLTGIGQEGNELHTTILSTGGVGDNPEAPEADLPVNHQWAKTWSAECLFNQYVHQHISPELTVGSPIRKYSELKVTELFAKNCWEKFGHKFSSCNVANYRQSHNNSELKWCGKCPKCANSYLLFAPFVDPEELNSLFPNGNLFLEKSLHDDFKGLLGLDGVMKPFECVGEIDELRKAYETRRDKSPEKSLPFAVPSSDFDRELTSSHNKDLAL